MPRLDRITVAGYKSIREQQLALGPLNVLIGGNGSGKSNLIQVFSLLNEIVQMNLQVAVGKAGGAEQLLHFGRKVTEQIGLDFEFGSNGYRCVLVPDADDLLFFSEETVRFYGTGFQKPYIDSLGGGHKETRLFSAAAARPTSGPVADYVLKALAGWKLYHFHDTSPAARVKQAGDLHDNEQCGRTPATWRRFSTASRSGTPPPSATSSRACSWSRPSSPAST